MRILHGNTLDGTGVNPPLPDDWACLPNRFRSFLYRNHRCYYVVTDDEMRVLGFIDVRQDLDTVLEERFPG